MRFWPDPDRFRHRNSDRFDRCLVKNRMCLPLSINFGPSTDQNLGQNVTWRLVGATKNEPVFSIAASRVFYPEDKLPIILYYYL